MPTLAAVNWARQNSSTTGTGPLTLTTAVGSGPTLLQALGAGITSSVPYSISDDGVEVEAGVGSYNGATSVFTRSPTTTFVGEVYDNSAPPPVNLAGPVVLRCTLNAEQYKVALSEDQGDALEGAAAPSASNVFATAEDLFNNPSGGISLQYDWSTDNTASDPGSGKIKANNDDLALATELYVSDVTSAGNSADPAWLSWREGDYTGVYDVKDAGEGNSFRLDGSITDNTTWFTVPVTPLATTGTPAIGNNRAVICNLVANPNSRMPIGGTLGQVQTKLSAVDYAVDWTQLPVRTVRVKVLNAVFPGGVAAAGYDDASGLPLVNVADVSAPELMPVIGFNALGILGAGVELDVIVFGVINYDTSAWLAGTKLYQGVSAIVTAPLQGGEDTAIGVVLKSAIAGKLLVQIDSYGPWYLDSYLQDPPADGFGHVRENGAWNRGSRVFEAATSPARSVGDFWIKV